MSYSPNNWSAGDKVTPEKLNATESQVALNEQRLNALNDVASTGNYGDLNNKPTALKNPNKLTINGTDYDGSEAVTLTISGGSQITSEAITTALGYTPVDPDDVPTELPSPGKLTINGTEYDGSEDVSVTVSGSGSGGLTLLWEGSKALANTFDINSQYDLSQFKILYIVFSGTYSSTQIVSVGQTRFSYQFGNPDAARFYFAMGSVTWGSNSVTFEYAGRFYHAYTVSSGGSVTYDDAKNSTMNPVVSAIYGIK